VTLFQEKIVQKARGPIPLDPMNLDEYSRLPEDLLNLWNEVSVYTFTRTLVIFQLLMPHVLTQNLYDLYIL